MGWKMRQIVAALALGAAAISAAEGPDQYAANYGEALAFLTAQGYSPESYSLLATWNQRLPGTDAGFVRGYRLRTLGAGDAFDLYSREGRLLEGEEARRLGVMPANWETEGIEQAAVRSLGRTSKTHDENAIVPVGRRYGITPADIITLAPLDLEKVQREDAAGLPGAEKGMVRIGVYRTLPVPVTLHGDVLGHGQWQVLPDGGYLWTLAIRSPDALGQRLEFTELALPPGAKVVVYGDSSPDDVSGPFDRIPPGETSWWTPACFGEVLIVECYVPASGDRLSVALRIDRIAHLYKSVFAAAMEKAAGACNLDVTCYPAWADTALGIGGLGVIGDTGVLFCTCTLLADSIECNDIPYVLTANHCVRAQTGTRGASTLEFYWLYQTPECDGSPPLSTSVPRTTGGADYLAGMGGSGSAGGGCDFTFMRMHNAPPAGLTYVGWTASSPPLDTEVTCIHHPRGDFKRISFGRLSNIDNPYSYWFHEVRWHDGTTENGSSGSPLMIAETHQIIGQLWGGTASCNLPDDPDYYGRFSRTYPLIAVYLNAVPRIGFVQTNYSVNESYAFAAISVTLNGPFGGAGLTVNYSAQADTASAGADFTPVSGTLSFGFNATTASFYVPILQDTTKEVPETILLSLTNPSCGELMGGAVSAMLTIIDDDPDTDGDGLSDYDEIHGVFGYITNPNKADTDHDGLSDFDELFGVYGYETDPTRADTDGDGVPDYLEILFGMNPLDPWDSEEVPSLMIPWFEPR